MQPTQKHFLANLLILLAVLAAFGRVIGNEFVDWDDESLIWQNPNFNPPTVDGLMHHWNPHDLANETMYMPVTNTAWWLLAHMAAFPRQDSLAAVPQLRAGVFHAASLLAHAVSALLVMQILLQLVGNPAAALAGALLFALHPLQTEAVAWATGLKDTLSGMLALLAIWQYILAIKAEDWRRQRRYYLASLLAFALALLAKPSAMVVPLMMLAIGVGLLRQPWRRALIFLIPWLLLAAVGALSAKLMQPAAYVDAGPLWARPLIAMDSLSFYLVKLCAPIHLTFDYGRTPTALLNDPTHPLWWTWIFPAGIAVAVICNRNRAWHIGGLLFVVGLLPVLGLMPFDFQYYSTVADRYVYLAMLGPALVLATALKRWPAKSLRMTVAIALLIFAGLGFNQAGVWADSRTLAAHGLQMNPRSFASLAVRALSNRRQYALAMARHDPKAAELILAEAEIDARRYMELNGLNSGYDQLVWVLTQQNRHAEAAQIIRRQMEAQPQMPKLFQRDLQVLQHRLDQQLNAAAMRGSR